MFNNWRIGRPFGIDVFISGWFWLLPILIFATSFANGGLDAALFDTASLLAVFVCVGLHELGHALAARGYGIRTRDITLYPIGGVARLERMPEQPSAEMVIALAGPAVNVVLAAVLGGLWFAGQAVLTPMGSTTTWVSDFVARLAIANVVLVVFNLIPAFPMDGGRVFRAFLSWFTTRETATNIAGWVGAGFAVLIGLFALVQMNFMLMFLAVTLYMIGRQEVMAVRWQEAEKRRQAEWEAAQHEWYDPQRYRGHAGRSEADGWVYDAENGEWVDYRDGRPVRRFRRD
jgi:Zn-dependent protease